MPTYAILANPGHNRVYFQQSEELSLAELEIACRRLPGSCGNYRREELGGVPYLLLDSGEEEGRLVPTLSRLSFSYAVFRLEEGLLRPVEKQRSRLEEGGLSTILKYSGKTNELFTRLMINVALYSGPFGGEEKTVLLDPVAGKGTTLFEGLAAGHDVLGIELGDRAVHECATHLKKYLESARYKHEYHRERLSGDKKSFTATVHRFRMAPTKEAYKDEGAPLHQTLTAVAGDARFARQYFKKGAAHAIVGDLPYGVAHGNVAGGHPGASLTRSPRELLSACLPGWREVLRPCGTIALAWNTFVYPRAQMERQLEENGFRVFTEPPYDRLEHRVDQSIRRDIVVAQK